MKKVCRLSGGEWRGHGERGTVDAFKQKITIRILLPISRSFLLRAGSFDRDNKVLAAVLCELLIEEEVVAKFFCGPFLLN